MKHLKLFENWSINEDYLELKSIGKQLYSFLKKKGYGVEIKENTQKTKYGATLIGTKDRHINYKGGEIEIHQFSDVEEIGVFVPTYALAYKFIMDPDNEETLKGLLKAKTQYADYYLQNKQKDWYTITREIFGQAGRDIQNNPEIKKYIAKLGQELIGIVKEKYPNMQLSFEDKSQYYAMYFREPRTKKGGVVNPKQIPKKNI